MGVGRDTHHRDPLSARKAGVDLLHTCVQGEESPSVVIMHTNFYNSSLSALYLSEEKDDSRSACLWEQDLSDLPAAYIALGHWHNPTLPPVKINNVQLAYSGTPYPISKGENGERCALLIDVTSQGIAVQGVVKPAAGSSSKSNLGFEPMPLLVLRVFEHRKEEIGDKLSGTVEAQLEPLLGLLCHLLPSENKR